MKQEKYRILRNEVKSLRNKYLFGKRKKIIFFENVLDIALLKIQSLSSKLDKDLNHFFKEINSFISLVHLNISQLKIDVNLARELFFTTMSIEKIDKLNKNIDSLKSEKDDIIESNSRKLQKQNIIRKEFLKSNMRNVMVVDKALLMLQKLVTSRILINVNDFNIRKRTDDNLLTTLSQNLMKKENGCYCLVVKHDKLLMQKLTNITVLNKKVKML